MAEGERTLAGSSGTDATNAHGARARSETTTLVFAVTVAVALGVGCGLWINSLLSSAAGGRAARARTSPAVPPPAEAAAALQASAETTETTETTEAVGERAEAAAEAPAAKPAPAPAAREGGKQSKEGARPAAAPEAEKVAGPLRARARPSPCALYASASALTIRAGGAASLVVGGPGETGPVTVNTPSWANIAVFQEGRAANGWVRYTVKSVSKRPGLYTVRFATHCGSQTIPVTVK